MPFPVAHPEPLRPVRTALEGYAPLVELRQLAFDLKLLTARRPARRLLRDLQRTQHLPAEELRRLTDARSAAMVAFARTHSPFYARSFSGHGPVGDLSDPAAWSRLPIIDRSAVKASAADFATDEATSRRTRDVKTGGSTGEPLRMQHDARVPTLALSWRMYSWWGVLPHENIARIGRWGFSRRQSFVNDVAWWPTRQTYLDAALINRDTMATFHESITATRPVLLEGYVGAMLEFADFVESRRLRLPPLKAVATTAAPLTESVRERLQTVFGAPVHDEYRGSETGWTAGECGRRDGLHVFSDLRRLEVVGEDGSPLPAGEVGDLVVTDLTNRVFPLIRYRLGDRGALLDRPCPCGVTLPLMAKPDGRTTDMIRLPSGTVVGHRLMALFSAEPEAVRLFQIHQLEDYSIVVRVVLGDVPDAREAVERSVQELRGRTAHEVPVTTEYVESLPYDGGKTKYVVSDVPHGSQVAARPPSDGLHR